jgi:drug/metabolite transporter (DMT)-like permease
MEKQRHAYLLALISVLFWSTIASAFKVTLRYVDLFLLGFFSILTAVILLFLILFSQRKIGLIGTYYAKDFLQSALLGFLNPFLYYLVLLKAYDLLRAQEAMTLNYTWPIILSLLSIPILRQRIGWKNFLALFVSFSGVIIIATQGNVLSLRFTNILGVLLALSSTFIWSLYWLLNVKDRRDEVAKLFLNFVFGFLFILVTVLLFSRFTSLPFRGIIGVVYIGIFEMGITFVLWLKALQLSKTTARIANLIYLSPFLGLVIINRVVGERIFTSTILGLVLIVAGIFLQQCFVTARRFSGSEDR